MRIFILIAFLLSNLFGFAQDESLEFTSYLEEYELELDSNDNKELFLETCFWESVPYKYAGGSHKGVDCSKFSKHIYRAVFKDTIRGRARDLQKQSRPIEKDSLLQGDMVFFKIGGKSHVNHVGIYLKDNKFVHASTKKGITVSSLDMNYYKKYFFIGGRFCENQ